MEFLFTFFQELLENTSLQTTLKYDIRRLTEERKELYETLKQHLTVCTKFQPQT